MDSKISKFIEPDEIIEKGELVIYMYTLDEGILNVFINSPYLDTITELYSGLKVGGSIFTNRCKVQRFYTVAKLNAYINEYQIK